MVDRGRTVGLLTTSDLGKPVVTSIQATLWNALRVAGMDDASIRPGELFDH